MAIPPAPSAPRPPYAWIALLGVLSGAPYGLVTEALPTIWAAQKVDAATTTAFVADVSWPWTLKFLIAPLIDRVGSRRTWIVGGATLCTLVSLLFTGLDPRSLDGSVAATLFALAVVSAIQDVAIDAWAVEALPLRAYGPGNGVRVTAWRAGLLVFGAFLAGRVFGWGPAPAFLAGAAVFAAIALAAIALPAVPRAPRASSSLAEPIRMLVRARGFVAVVAFVLLFKAGDYAMPGALTKKLLVARGIAPTTIADVLTPIGIAATVGGALLGGAVTARIGIFRALWILGAFQALSNLAYAGAAWSGSHAALYGAAIFEPFCGGLGTAPFLAFLMTCCDRAHAATHFALWSAVMALGRWCFGRWSGAGAVFFGYGEWFAMTFLIAIPAYLLLPLVKRRLDAANAVAADPAAGAAGA